ncbi:AAA family ATPase [Myxococcota bacterium]|nr:AAA family ATPase [Myxococcota bacterium]MBU1432112.1 AAA family ATPase [Myxococcota bacterium]MBU1897896.1 AAA family ATPase [Myxococcota bacterium]
MSTRPLSSLEFSRYRCFRDPQRVELGAVNLIYGENNAGKSALLRLLPLIADARTMGQEGFNLESPALGDGPTHDLRWALNDEEPLSFGLTLGSGMRWWWRFEERRFSYEVSALQLNARCFERTQGHLIDSQGQALSPLAGLVPAMLTEASALAATLRRVTWLTAGRVGPSQNGRRQGIAPQAIKPNGEGAEGWALNDDALMKQISAFYYRHTGRSIETAVNGDQSRLTLSAIGGPQLSFSACGSGLQRVFSVLVAAELLRREGGILIVEEPEAHLHPKLQRALAEHLIGVTRANPAAQLLLETHSEVFLLAALAAAVPAEGNPSEFIRLHWLSAAADHAVTVTPIPLDERGQPTNGLLEQAYETLGVMRREILARRRRHAR